ncbi:3-hydroxyacyl-CoA dehydrogenase NAD-binding domain-containing protein [Rhodobacter sp. KR11]|uniref:3-hydroxyacyl-CoA dehydrogenase NAD-binding domain-containing protein n=1 Tax=Rhodobacter sp. KR11 TaxID=2974588 RepID=UPI002221DBBC|nr:3-hydroxyacyl-CoA dehydrogenase NAD-binding domain-containing protein [Rhodobacter sp. KR11]MCW1918472.1 3-hydroxyacyl-CoA dehydrogenase NAD-binding domain-containing protein [Rhodobacter sp. KR11]
MTDFTYDLDADGVAVITWDTPGRSMNVMSMAGFAELERLIDRALGDGAVKGVVLTSGKKDFAGGMDLNVLAQMQAGGTQAVFDGIMETHRFLRKIERAGMDPKTLKGGKPVVCAMPGTGLGIGFEIPLACHRIIAADNPKAKIGLPEILVGIFPGAGGTTRLIRKMGVMLAAPFLMEGKLLSPRLAKAEGLIDEVVPADQLLARAKEWVLTAKEADLVKPWDQKGYKLPGGAPYHPAGFQTFVGANAMILGKTQGCYPAAQALLQAAYEGTMVPFDTALRVEARAFTGVLMDPTSSAMIRSLFINKEALEKGARRPDLPDESVKVLGVIGAGMMGAGIAYVAANAGISVVLIDATQEAAEKGRAHAEALLEKGVQRRKVTPEKKAEVLARITATTDYAALAPCDLVVEAVFEDPSVKAEVTAKVEAATGAILATNTSTLPISGLAKASQRPGSYIGIHFFSPVDKMALVEIIRGKQTEDRAVAKALDFVRALRKTPIVVNDARFFYANRCIIPYINEGLRMVAEGVPPALIENAAKLLGMPLGPLQLVDETSIDLGVKIATATRAAMGDTYPDTAVDQVLFPMAEQGRLGRKAKAGFYAYDEAGKRLDLWEGLSDLWPVTQTPDLTTVQDRLLMIQALEAVRALDAGVLTDIREGDVGAILGWGFAPWSGGPFSWLDRIGAGQAVAICDGLAELGPRFSAPQSLRDMAASSAAFYPRPDVHPRAA